MQLEEGNLKEKQPQELFCLRKLCDSKRFWIAWKFGDILCTRNVCHFCSLVAGGLFLGSELRVTMKAFLPGWVSGLPEPVSLCKWIWVTWLVPFAGIGTQQGRLRDATWLVTGYLVLTRNNLNDSRSRSGLHVCNSKPWSTKPSTGSADSGNDISANPGQSTSLSLVTNSDVECPWSSQSLARLPV